MTQTPQTPLDIADVPAVEVVLTVAMPLMSAEASPMPDPPGMGPGESRTGPVN